jgi:carbonic anhydrase
MIDDKQRWLDQIVAENSKFNARIHPDKLPIARMPGPAVITCMDPRVNLESVGISGFSGEGEGESSVRIIRTLGAMADNRSLLVGIFLAGVREIVLLMHTDCGCCLAYSKIDVIVENMKNRLSSEAFRAFKAEIGEPFAERLRTYLKAFEDPHKAVKKEIESIRRIPFVPDELILHGLLYELNSGKVEVVVNGYS